jgi:hypothetical protein
MTKTSNLSQVDKLKEPPIVDQWYLVESVQDIESLAYFPIRGILHNDIEILGCDRLHWHYDWRFMSHRLMRLIGMNPYDERDWEDAPTRIFVKEDANNILYRRFKCKRTELSFPASTYDQDILGKWTNKRVALKISEKLYGVYKGQYLNHNKCPHRGYDMSSVPANEDGKKKCPLHGLKFNAKGKVCT